MAGNEDATATFQIFADVGSGPKSTPDHGQLKVCKRPAQDGVAAHVGDVGEMGELETVDPADWFRRPGGGALASQTLAQQKGHAMTLLVLEDQDDLPSPPTFRRSTRKR